MISARVNKYFVDQSKVLRHMDRKRRRVLIRTGALARTVMRRSMRKRKGASKPGSPPYSHSGELRKLIYFGYDDDRQSILVGPILFRGRNGTKSLEGKTVPQLIDEGGSAYLPTGKVAQYLPRPYRVGAMEQGQELMEELIEKEQL